MFHPLWPDVKESLSVCQDCSSATTCNLCGHSSVIHRKGACHGNNCLCGWSRDMKGALSYASTGERADEVNVRKRYKGPRIHPRRRDELLRIPCYYCGKKAESIDHFIARAKGGLSGPSNLVSACLVCNGMKGDKSYDELIVFCRQMESAEYKKTSPRSRLRFLEFQKQAKKILAWHEKRIVAKRAPVP